MSAVLIFSFDNGDGSYYISVFRDSTDPTIIIGAIDYGYAPDQPLFPTYSSGDFVGNFVCEGTTLIRYGYKTTPPYVNVVQVFNSPVCGYAPPVCDLTLSTLTHTDETSAGADDGTVSVFYTSSYLPVLYNLVGIGFSEGSGTGFFTGVPPGDYEIRAVDANGCTAKTNVTIQPYDASKTRCKYILEFYSVKNKIKWELKFLYQKAQFDPLLYPKQLTGTDSPIVRKTTNSDEDKTTAFAASSLEINIYANGETFEVSEFADAQERDWKIELYKDGQLDWQGWLLPDELQDLYSDPNYTIQLIATDGLLSLKGGSFGDQSLFYTDAYGVNHLYQLFGLKKWVYLVKICLDQLGYDYGNTTLISSLTYKVFAADQWLNYSTWSDLFYDENGIPKDTYSALEILLKGLKLQIVQNKGYFVLWDMNDVYYRNTTKLQKYCFLFNNDFTSITSGVLPANGLIGYNKTIRPSNPQQTLNYDKAFNQMEADVSFSLLSLLYPNPSFEFNSIQGELPYLFNKYGTIDAYVNYDPQNPLDPTIGAYAGDWELKLKISYPGGHVFDFDNFIYFQPIVIDQPHKKLNFSYYWRAYPVSSGYPNTLPTTLLVFQGTSGTKYAWFVPVSGEPSWIATPDPIGRTASPNISTTDYKAWNNFSITTTAFPEDSGILEIRIAAPSYWEPGGGGNPPAGTLLQVDIDALVLTLSDSNDVYNFQTGENHIVTNLTTFAKSEKKTIDLSLFTFPNNKRVSGNMSYGDDYITSKITNEWLFALSTEQVADRLPANIIRRFAKNYQRPMYKYQGDFISDIIDYYSVFVLSGYENRVFVAFTLETDLRNSTGNIVLIEIDDTQMQSTYQYVPVYEKSARNNLS